MGKVFGSDSKNFLFLQLSALFFSVIVLLLLYLYLIIHLTTRDKHQPLLEFDFLYKALALDWINSGPLFVLAMTDNQVSNVSHKSSSSLKKSCSVVRLQGYNEGTNFCSSQCWISVKCEVVSR